MQFSTYQRQAMDFRKPTADEAYTLLGLSGEVGELHSLFAKAIRDGVTDPEALRLNVKKELGDILWFVATIATDTGFELDEVAEANIEKLTSRAQRGVIGGSGDNR